MSSLNHAPAIRHLKARLRILKRPMVWGSAAILLLALFSVYTVLQRPEWLTVDESDRVSPAATDAENSATDPNVPPEEDNAIGMDIDSLSVLRDEISDFDDADESELLAQPRAGDESAAPAQTQTGSPLVSSSTQTNSASQDFSSAYAQSGGPLSLNLFNTPNLLQGSTASTPDSTASSSGASFGLGGTPQSAPPANPLRSAVEQYANSSSQPSSQSQTQDSEAETETTATTSGQQPTTIPATIPGLPSQPGQYAPRTSPPPGTTGYTIPPSLYVPGSSYANQGNLQSAPGLPQAPQILPQTIPAQPGVGQSPVQTPYGGGTGSAVPTPNVQPQAAPPQPQPFSVPRSSAGYSIGGREIETFSNP